MKAVDGMNAGYERSQWCEIIVYEISWYNMSFPRRHEMRVYETSGAGICGETLLWVQLMKLTSGQVGRSCSVLAFGFIAVPRGTRPV